VVSDELNVQEVSQALHLGSELKLIEAEDVQLITGLLAIGLKLSDDSGSWSTQLTGKCLNLEQIIQNLPYHKHLKGGPKPRTANGRPDWGAKDQYLKAKRELDNLTGLRERLKTRMAQDKPFNGVGPVFQIHSILQQIQTTKGHSHQLLLRETSANDLRLCLAWSNHPVAELGVVDISYLVQVLEAYEANRLISARMAEHAARQYYEELGQVVVDVSITQLSGDDDRWKQYDLLANGQPIDVKNARRSFSSPDAYVEHCVPKFKQLRSSSEDVLITGVLSNYKSSSSDEATVYPCTILGEVTASNIQRLTDWATRRFGHILNLAGLWRPEYQPGWVFEYRPEHYVERSTGIASIPELIQGLKSHGVENNKLPGWLLTLCPDRELSRSLEISSDKRRILDDLHSLSDQIGLNRPSLFILVMGTYLESMVSETSNGKPDRLLRDLLFIPSAPHSAAILGLDDPQYFIGNLVSTLEKVYEEAINQRLRFVAFKLTHPSILRGQLATGLWITVLAYCGGWREVPVRARCGKTPLFFGQHGICTECGHLVCDECGHCSYNCALLSARQKEIVNTYRNIINHGHNGESM
jgi:hypothetical protein